MSKNNGKLIKDDIKSVKEALKIAKELGFKVYENVVDYYWGASEEPIKNLI